MLLSKYVKKCLQKVKKCVDKSNMEWYSIKAVGKTTTVWKNAAALKAGSKQNLDNWTVKQPWKFLKKIQKRTDIKKAKSTWLISQTAEKPVRAKKMSP